MILIGLQEIANIMHFIQPLLGNVHWIAEPETCDLSHKNGDLTWTGLLQDSTYSILDCSETRVSLET